MRCSRSHLEDGRFRLWILELQGKPISAQLFIGAGGEVAYVNGGWDERFAHLKPAMLGILYAIEDAFAHSHERMDLGAGALPYKQRFADGSDPVAWNILVVPGSRLPLTVLRTAPMLAGSALRDKAKRALSAEQAERLRRSAWQADQIDAHERMHPRPATTLRWMRPDAVERGSASLSFRPDSLG